MKKIILTIFTLMTFIMVSAQTMNIESGGVIYQVPVALAGDMTYTDGQQLTVLDKSFAISDITNIYINGSEVVENQVAVRYETGTTRVTIPYNIMSVVDVTVSGDDVVIMQGDAVAEEITYTLSGSTSAGSLYMDGSYKATFVLDGVSITNPNGAAINIRDGKRINVVINDGTVNTLVDGANGDQKGCFAVKGHTEFSGAGTLNITGNSSHGFWGKEYVEIKKSVGTINILKAAGDGFNVNQYFKMNGGTVNINNVGDDGIQVSFKTDDNDNVIALTEDADNTGELLIQGGNITIATTAAASKGLKSEGAILFNEEKTTANITITNSGGVESETSGGTTDYTSSACIKSDVSITVDAGTLNLTNTGQGGRAINCEQTITINGGVINAAAKGTNYGSSGGSGGGPGGGGGWPGGGGGWPGGGSSSNSKNAKCIKAKGDLTITGGTIVASSANHECIESKAKMNISGGTIYAEGKDDAINSTSDMTITGGNIYAYAASNDALDSNGNMIIKGGYIAAFGGSGAETGIDIDEQHNLQISGGCLLGIGGRIDSRFGTCTQAYGYTSRSASFSGGYIVLSDSSNKRLFAVKMPRSSYSGIVVCSSPDMTKGSTYSVGYASSLTGDEVNGFVANPTAGTVNSVSNGSFTAR